MSAQAKTLKLWALALSTLIIVVICVQILPLIKLESIVDSRPEMDECVSLVPRKLTLSAPTPDDWEKIELGPWEISLPPKKIVNVEGPADGTSVLLKFNDATVLVDGIVKPLEIQRLNRAVSSPEERYWARVEVEKAVGDDVSILRLPWANQAVIDMLRQKCSTAQVKEDVLLYEGANMGAVVYLMDETDGDLSYDILVHVYPYNEDEDFMVLVRSGQSLERGELANIVGGIRHRSNSWSRETYFNDVERLLGKYCRKPKCSNFAPPTTPPDGAQ